MKVVLAGDWHGDADWARGTIEIAAQRGVSEIFQLGDFALGWPGKEAYFVSVEKFLAENGCRLYIVPGNHENYDFIEKQLVFTEGVCRMTARVTVLGRGFRGELPPDKTLVALGGAPSIDFQFRTIGRSWWPAEMIKLEEAEKVAADGYADIMLAHDCPTSACTKEVQAIRDSNPAGWTDAALRYAHEGAHLMDIAFRGVKPKLFAHGHYHVKGEAEVDGTKFISLACNNMDGSAVILDTETLEHEWI